MGGGAVSKIRSIFPKKPSKDQIATQFCPRDKVFLPLSSTLGSDLIGDTKKRVKRLSRLVNWL